MFQATLLLVVLLGVVSRANVMFGQSRPVTGFIRAPGNYDLGGGCRLDIVKTEDGGLDIKARWRVGVFSGLTTRPPAKLDNWFVFVESPEMVWLAYDGGNDLRVMMTDESHHSGVGPVNAALFETCPKELRDALPTGGPKNLASNNSHMRSMTGGEVPAGVGIHPAAANGAEPPVILGVVRASPAARAGIKPGSFLLSINGTNTATLSATQCRRMISGRVGTAVDLELADSMRQQTNHIRLERSNSLIAD